MTRKISTRTYARAALFLGAASCAAGVGLSSSALAFVQDQAQLAPQHKAAEGWTLGIRTLRPDLKTEGSSFAKAQGKSSWSQVQTDVRSGSVRVISGAALTDAPRLKRTSREDFVKQALDFVTDNHDSLGVKAGDLRLNQDATVLTKENQFLKFQVYRDGLKVEDASVDFRFKFGRLVQVVNKAYGEAGSDLRSGLGNLDAKAKSALIEGDAKELGESYRVVASGKGYDLVRVTRFSVANEHDTYVVSVENATGKIFEVRPTTFNLAGSAKGAVFPRWYTEQAQSLAYPNLTLSYTGGTVTTDANGAFTGAPESAQPKLDGFVGTRVKVNTQTGTKVSATGARVRDQWSVVYQKPTTPNTYEDKDTAQSMAYYHLELIIGKGKQYLPNVAWMDRQLTANVNLSQTCNAYWDGSTVNFYSAGGGCANTALISDVMYHEWGHGLDANTGGIDDGAWSEGFGDVMSLVVTHSNILGIGFKTDGAPVRDLEPNKVYPRDSGEVHAEGLIIGGTFWDLFKGLRDAHGEEKAGQLLEKYAFLVIPTASNYTDVYDALLVIDDDNGDLNDKTPNYCTINKAFAEHGLATADEACNLASVDRVEIDDQQGGNGNGILEPGESVTLNLVARNASPTAADGMTGQLTVSGATGVRVTDGSLAWTTLPARSSSRSTDPAALEIGSSVACGQKFTATVALASGTRTATVTQDLMVGRLDGHLETLAVTGLPQDIRDNASTTVSVAASSDQWEASTAVQTLRLKFDITHPYVGDLSVQLIAPNGTAKEVYRGSGSADDVHFDQDVSTLFAGVAGRGNWQLKVTDNANQDQGTLNSASLDLTPARFVCE